MYESLTEVLSDQWVMFYHTAWPANQLTPVCTLDQCLQRSNENLQSLGRIISQWPAGDQNQIARLVRMNWIYQRLPIEPIRKPILAHAQDQELIVDCGDTRLMALSLMPAAVTVQVIVTDRADRADRYALWTCVRDEQDLLAATGFDRGAHISFTAGKDQALTWLEIGDQSTAHHLHDQDQRVRMMQAYLNHQPTTLLFDRAWAVSAIDWSAYERQIS